MILLKSNINNFMRKVVVWKIVSRQEILKVEVHTCTENLLLASPNKHSPFFALFCVQGS